MQDFITDYKLFGLVFLTIISFAYLGYVYWQEREEMMETEETIKKSGHTQDELKNELQNLFLNPNNGIITFLKNYNLFRIYHKDELKNLYIFYEKWDSKIFKFDDSELYSLLSTIYADNKVFLLTLYSSSRETHNNYMRAETHMDELFPLMENIVSNYEKVDKLITKGFTSE